MYKPLYIYSSSNFCHGVKGELPSLKPVLLEVTGKKMRRIDRLTQLALIGSFQCKSGFELPEKTGLYLSSIYGSLNNTSSVLREIFQNAQLPRPLTFINSVSNAACFYLAEQLGLSANNQFVSRDHFSLEAGLKLARLDLENGNVQAALVGLVCEVGENLAIHRQRFQIEDQYTLAEGSHWLYLAHSLAAYEPVAKITHIAEPLSAGELNRQLQQLLLESRPPTALGFGSSVTKQQQEGLQQILNLFIINDEASSLKHEFSTAKNICSFLKNLNTEENIKRLIHIDTDGDAQWSVIVIEKC